MKRTVLLLLTLLLTVQLFACAKPQEELSEPVSEASAGTESPAEEISDGESSEEISVPECAKKAEIDAIFEGEVEKDLPRANALYQKGYTVTGNVSEAYPDNGVKLNDGSAALSFNRYSWVGFEPGISSILFDLGEVAEKIGAFNGAFLSLPEYGIYFPQDLTVYISSDGENFARAGKIGGYADSARAQTCDFAFNLREYVSARYIKFEFRNTRGFVFLSELEAFVYGEERDDSLDLIDVYPEYTVPHSELIYRENGSAEFMNLALGAEVHATAFAKVQKRYAADGYANVQDTSLLCDGKTSVNPSWDSDISFRMTRGEGRDIVFDLGYTAAVSSFSAQSVYMPTWGVFPPDDICVCVSADGEEWQNVAVMSVDPALLDGSYKPIEFSAQTEQPYQARFVRFIFIFNTHCAITEFGIYGTEKVPEGALMPDRTKNGGKMPYEYPSDGTICGAQNILCSYLCDTRSNCGVYSEMLDRDAYLDIIGYYKDGELKDVIFETMVVTPHSNFASGTDKETLAGWQPYFDTLFTGDRGLEAISQAAAEIGKVRGEADYKEGVFLSVIRPCALVDGKTNEFGDIDGDGVNESFDSLENRKKVIRWEVDMQLERLARINAPNIKLLGFYWLSEAIYYDQPDEVEIVKYAIDYVHSKGYVMFWIPYYNASGWNTWRELGFDFACLQPNYCFTSENSPDRLFTTALKARLYGMAVEMELSNSNSDDNVKMYKEYIKAGLEYGYSDVTKVYYLGGVPSDLTTAKKSVHKYENSIYEDTYLYSKRALNYEDYKIFPEITLTAPTCEPMSGKEGKRITGQLRVESDYNYLYVVTVQPKYGSLQINASGKVIYIPEKGFYGEDHFCVAAKYLTGTSEGIRVDVNVEYVPEE